MSYEEIDRENYENDVFTGGAEGRYAKPKATSEKKKRAPKIPTTGETADQSTGNGQTDEVVKTKKKTKKTQEHNDSMDLDATAAAAATADGEQVVKPKKKRAPKIESNDENLNPVETTEGEPVKKKKSKAPKVPVTEEEAPLAQESNDNDLEPTVKVKKSKKTKKPKTTETFDDLQTNEYPTTTEFNEDLPQDVPIESEQISGEPDKSAYEAAIYTAFNNFASKMNFGEYVGNDQWCILHLPKSARVEPKSRIRKMLPGGNNPNKSDDKSSNGKNGNQQKGIFNRFFSGVNTLVRDESNLLFGEGSKYDVGYYEEEEDDVDTDNLHRYAQKLREYEDQDREVNPEFLILRDGKTVYGVHEVDSEGKTKVSTRKPIYDRQADQDLDETPEKKKFLSRLRRNPFARNKDKDSKESNSPQSSHGTPDNRKKHDKKRSSDAANND